MSVLPRGEVDVKLRGVERDTYEAEYGGSACMKEREPRSGKRKWAGVGGDADSTTRAQWVWVQL